MKTYVLRYFRDYGNKNLNAVEIGTTVRGLLAPACSFCSNGVPTLLMFMSMQSFLRHLHKESEQLYVYDRRQFFEVVTGEIKFNKQP